MTRARSLAALTGTALLVAGLTGGCAGTDRPSAPSSHAGADPSEKVMQGMEMTSPGPSGAASMVCESETRDAVRRTLALHGPVRASSAWSPRERMFTCVYRLPHGRLRVSVQDALRPEAGAAFYKRLRSTLPGARPLAGMQSLGLPGFEATGGTVVFLKDGKTLRVDAGGLPSASLPAGFSKKEVAYGVASAVVACWSQ